MSTHPPRLARRLLALLLPSAAVDDVLPELAELHAARAARRGMRAANVWYWSQVLRFPLRFMVARLRDGGAASSGERPSRRTSGFAAVGQDVRAAARGLAREPRFALVAVLTLALGIGATTAIFSLVWGVLYRPLPFPDAERLLAVGSTQTPWPGDRVYATSPANFLDLRQNARAFSALAAMTPGALVLVEGGAPAALGGLAVTGDFFPALGVRAQLGRLPDVQDDNPAADAVILLSDRLWRTRFGADPDIVGRTLRFDEGGYGGLRTVVGVAPRGFGFRTTQYFAGAEDAEFWIPMAWDAEDRAQRQSYYLQLIGRLAPGATVASANAELQALWSGIVAAHNVRGGIGAVPVQGQLVAAARRPLHMLAGAVALVLLIACANVANLLLARAESRRRELAVRAALGAARGRLVRLLLGESVLLALAGAVLGALGAIAAVRVLTLLFAPVMPRIGEVSVSGTVLLFAFALALASGIATGLIGLAGARVEHTRAALQAGARSVGTGRQRVRRTLVITEAALAFSLLAAAGVLTRSFWRLHQVDPGFRTEDLLTARLALPDLRYPDPAVTTRFYHDLAAAVARLPGVESAAAADAVPLLGGSWNRPVHVTGQLADTVHGVEMRYVTPGLIETLEVPLRAGRAIETRDDAGSPSVVVVNETLARRLFGASSPVGRRLSPMGLRLAAEGAEIVGVVADVHEFGPHVEPPPIAYFPHAQSEHARRVMSITVRTRPSHDAAVIAGLRQAVQAADPALPIVQLARIDELFADRIHERTVLTTLLVAFGALAIALGMAGVYSVMSYTVAQSRREIGVRLALGAQPAGLRRSVLRHALILVSAGIGIGLMASLLFQRVLRGFVFEVSASDPVAFVAGGFLLAGSAALGSYLPARRAAAVHPMEVLRE